MPTALAPRKAKGPSVKDILTANPEVERLGEKCAQLTKALEFYAKRDNYLMRGTYKRYRYIDTDGGRVAREALGEE